MSTSESTFEFIMAQLSQAYFPYLSFDTGHFCWARGETRTVVWLNDKTVAKAGKMLRKISRKYTITENESSDEILALLSDDRYKAGSWVKDEVTEIYRILATRGHMRSIEARFDGELAGALVGIDLGNVFIAETLLTIQPDSSKACLCYIVIQCAERGYAYLDVQCPHPPAHPVARLGEQTMPMAEYLDLLSRTQKV